MSVTPTGQPDTLTARAAEEIRAILGRRRISGAELARRLGVSQMWVSDRLRGVTAIDLIDLERIAKIVDVPARDLIPSDVATSHRYRPKSRPRKRPIIPRAQPHLDWQVWPAGGPDPVRVLAPLAL